MCHCQVFPSTATKSANADGPFRWYSRQTAIRSSATSATADHGVAVVDVRDERIAFWREYQRKGPVAFADFFAVEGKTWQWHIGNYP